MYIDQEIERLLQERHMFVWHLFTAGREGLDQLANVLMRKETAEQGTLQQILGPRPTITVQIVRKVDMLDHDLAQYDVEV